MDFGDFLEELHIFSRGTSYFGVHSRSMLAFELGKEAYQLLADLKSRNGVDTSGDGPSIQRSLSGQALVFLEDLRKAVYENPLSFETRPDHLTVENLMLLVRQDCNLRCDYCFATQGTYGRPGTQRFMSFETAKRAIDYVVDAGYCCSGIDLES